MSGGRSQALTAERIAIDGKSITSTVSFSHEAEPNFVSLASFFSQHRTLIVTVGLLENHQTSEISVVPELLNQFEITTAVFTLEAWHGQQTTVLALIKSGHHYVITVNQNQPKRHAAIIKPTPTTPPGATWSWTQTGPGHTVKCRLQVYLAPAAMKSPWTGLPPVISVNRRGERDGKSFHTTTYYLTSETNKAYALAPTIRGPRKI